jgi:hypothetical protein
MNPCFPCSSFRNDSSPSSQSYESLHWEQGSKTSRRGASRIQCGRGPRFIVLQETWTQELGQTKSRREWRRDLERRVARGPTGPRGNRGKPVALSTGPFLSSCAGVWVWGSREGPGYLKEEETALPYRETRGKIGAKWQTPKPC